MWSTEEMGALRCLNGDPASTHHTWSPVESVLFKKAEKAPKSACPRTHFQIETVLGLRDGGVLTPRSKSLPLLSHHVIGLNTTVDIACLVEYPALSRHYTGQVLIMS